MSSFSRRLDRLEAEPARLPREALVTLTFTRALALRLAVFSRWGVEGEFAGGLAPAELRDEGGPGFGRRRLRFWAIRQPGPGAGG
jgi:hypothetical protein